MGRGRTVLATSAGLVLTLALLALVGVIGIHRLHASNAAVDSAAARVEAYAEVQRALAVEAVVDPAAQAASDRAVQGMALALAGARERATSDDRAELDAMVALQAQYAEHLGRSVQTPQQVARLQAVLDVLAQRAARARTSASSNQRALLGRMSWRAPVALLTTLVLIGLCWAAVVRLGRRAARLAAASERLALRDTLTGVANRLAFERALGQELARREPDCALLLLDLDGFKAINDTWGHDTGDAVLTAVAERLQAGVRETDLVARIGGDEFAVLARPAHQVEALGERLQASVSRPLDVKGLVLHPAASLGLVELTPQCTRDEVLRAADAYLYADKHRRRADDPRRGLTLIPSSRDPDSAPASSRHS